MASGHEWAARGILAGVVLGAGALVYACVDEDEPAGDTPAAEDELRACPDFLEVGGPYRRGIDAEYDPAHDWDSDGVSCE